MAARMAGRTWPQSMELAMKAAAWTVSQPYCSTGFPTPAGCVSTLSCPKAGRACDEAPP